jgi:hypothetical protein
MPDDFPRCVPGRRSEGFAGEVGTVIVKQLVKVIGSPHSVAFRPGDLAEHASRFKGVESSPRHVGIDGEMLGDLVGISKRQDR